MTILFQRLKIDTTLICVEYRNPLPEHIIFLITVSTAMQLLLHGNTWQGQLKLSVHSSEWKKVVRMPCCLTFHIPKTLENHNELQQWCQVQRNNPSLCLTYYASIRSPSLSNSETHRFKLMKMCLKKAS